LLLEETEASHRRESRKNDYVYKPKLPSQAVPLPLPPPPVKLDKPQGCGIPERRGTENAASVVDNKVVALQTYHKARGLCQFCAEKWVRGHKCSQTV
jgi:hypothetical protein